MGIELPGVSDVEQAIAVWRANDPVLETLLARYADAADALRHYGLILWDQGKPETAARVFSGAVALKPEDARVWTDLAGALHAGGQLHQAAACMEEALFRDKMQADGWLRLGSIRSALDDPSGAEQALTTALALDPGLTDARLSLGLVLFHCKRFDEAVIHFQEVLQTESVGSNAAVQACYGQALSHLGDFAGAAAALKIAIALEPDNQVVALKLAQVQFIADVLTGPLDAAVAACRASPFVTAAAFATIERQAFHLLGAFGHTDAALRLGVARLAATPDDPECAYLLDVLRGDPLQRPPNAYVVSFFDQFAEEFDTQLGLLGYTAYRPLAALVETHATRLDRILDLGCGTGLAGPLLAKPGRHLVGLDLSSRMLAKARERGCYGAFIEAEAVTYLAGKTGAFDLVFAADVLIYVGAVDELMTRVAQALKAGGLFAFTIETSTGADLELLSSGRFAHRLGHVLALAAASGFALVATEAIQVRYETNGFVAGELVVLRQS